MNRKAYNQLTTCVIK